jgi:hypothetical protein
LRRVLVPVQLLTLAILAVSGGCDRQDNDWHLYQADLKLVHIPGDSLLLSESGGTVAIPVTIGMVPADTVFVYPASRDSQIFFRPDSIFFAPVDDDWLPERVIEVQAFNDDVREGDHVDEISFVVRSGDPAYDGQGLDVLIPVFVTDNDIAGVAVSETLLTLVESSMGAVSDSYHLTLDSQPTAPVTITATVIPDEPSLHIAPTEVVFDASNWDQEQEITLWAELDGIDFDYQSLVIEHSCASADTNYDAGLTVASVDLEILDDTLPPVATLAAVAAQDTVPETLPAGYDITVSLNRASVVPVTVHLASEDGTARGGSDFTALNQDVTFQPGAPLTQTFTIQITDDSVLEETEAFQVVITAVGDVIIGAEDRIGIAIIDNDFVTLSLTATDAAEDSGSALFEVSIPGAAEFPISFSFVTADGTALAGEDYEAANDNFVLEPGQTSRTIPVVLLADAIREVDETFTGALTGLSDNAVWTDPPVVCTIVNDDPQNVVFADVSCRETEGSAVFSVELLRPFPQDVNLVVNTLNGDGLGGAADQVDALAGSDFTAAVGAIWTIPAGTLAGTFTVPVTNDLQAEAAQEYFRLEITSASESEFVGLVSLCTLIDDHQPCVQAADVSVGEDGGTVTFTLQLRDQGGAPVTSSADVLLQVDTQDQTASAGSDYDAVSGIFTIPAGQPSVDLTVAINDDLHDDDNETFILLVTSPVNAQGGCTQEPAFCTIVDDEFPSINIQSSLQQLNEGSVFSFNIALTTQRQTATSFDLALLPGTSGGTGVDYTFNQNGSHFIPPFTDFITFTVPFLDDALEGETDEIIEVTIANANCALGVVSLEATIVDAPELSITGDSVLEGEVAWFTVTADAASTADIQFNVQHASDTAVSGVDFSDANTGPFTIAAGQTSVQVPVPTTAGDGGDNATESFFVTIINPTNATNSPFNSAVGQITDGDPPLLTWAGTASAVEGDDIIMTVNLSWTSGAPIQFSVQYTDGTAARLGIDYDDSSTGPFTVAPGNLTYQLAVPTSVDGLPELSAEDFTVTLLNPVNAVIGTPSFTTGYVLDADQPELSFTMGQTAVEGGDLTFTVQLSQVTPVPVSFEVQYDNGSTQGAVDFVSTNVGPFTINPGNATTTVTVATVDDADLEGVESFIIRVANPVNAILGNDFEASGTIIDND